MQALTSTEFWLAVGQIIGIDILLGADNAVVIALACRQLPDKLRTQGIVWGTVGAIALRVVLIFFALSLLTLPWVKLVGAVLLVWVGVKLIQPEQDDPHGSVKASDKLWGAVRTVIVADFVMSVDNVIGIAGAAHAADEAHRMILVVFGLALSVPLIVWGSQWIIRLMTRFPVVITLGATLLGWIAGDMAIDDHVLDAWPPADLIKPWAGAAGAVLVYLLGLTLAAFARKSAAKPT